MKSFEFRLLDYQQQLDFLYKRGIYLSKRKKGPYTIILLQYNQFYVEVFYIKYRQFVSKIKCFESPDLLEPYLQEMDLEDLWNELKFNEKT